MSTAVCKLATSNDNMTTNFLFCKQTSRSLQYFRGKPTDGISCVQVPIEPFLNFVKFLAAAFCQFSYAKENKNKKYRKALKLVKCW
jgi:hypothetical protein